MAKSKATPRAAYLVLRAFGTFAEGETLDAGALGDELEARIADGFIAPSDESAAVAESVAVAESATATTVVGANGTITATVQ